MTWDMEEENENADSLGPVVLEGDVFTIDALEWFEAWEFYNPTVILRPVYREYDASRLDDAIEDILLDAVCEGQFRGYGKRYGLSLSTMKRRFREALNGREFPQRGFTAKRVHVRITRDGDGLAWEEIDALGGKQ